MKKFLIAVNAVLAFFLIFSLWGAFFSGEKETLEVGKKKNQRKTQNAASVTVPAVRKKLLPDSQKAANSVVRKNIFDPQRSGGVTGGRGRGAVTYSLVGFYKVNKTQGAIIMTKGGGRSNQPVKQYFKVGEVLPNGYTLSAINNNQAVLSRGESRMTLNMAQASENNTVRRTVRRNVNPMQQMLNLMQQSVGMQQRQQMNMMRWMQNNQNSGNRSRGSTNSRRR